MSTEASRRCRGSIGNQMGSRPRCGHGGKETGAISLAAITKAHTPRGARASKRIASRGATRSCLRAAGDRVIRFATGSRRPRRCAGYLLHFTRIACQVPSGALGLPVEQRVRPPKRRRWPNARTGRNDRVIRWPGPAEVTNTYRPIQRETITSRALCVLLVDNYAGTTLLTRTHRFAGFAL